jgi:hypothetical protein
MVSHINLFDAIANKNKLHILNAITCHRAIGNKPFEQRDISGTPPLIAAVYTKDNSIIKCLLNHGLHNKKYINIYNRSGDTALMEATRIGCFDIVKTLNMYGADIHLENHQKNTALTIAVMSQRVEIAKFLLNHGAQFIINNENQSPLTLNVHQIQNYTLDKHGDDTILKIFKQLVMRPSLLTEKIQIHFQKEFGPNALPFLEFNLRSPNTSPRKLGLLRHQHCNHKEKTNKNKKTKIKKEKSHQSLNVVKTKTKKNITIRKSFSWYN